MNTVRKASVLLMYLRRNGYSDTANALWLLFVWNNHKCTGQQQLVDWLNGNGSIESLLNKVEFTFTDIEVITVKIGFKSLNKLLAVLPKGIEL